MDLHRTHILRRVVAYIDHPVFCDTYTLEFWDTDEGRWRVEFSKIRECDAREDQERYQCAWIVRRGDADGKCRTHAASATGSTASKETV